MTSIRYADRYRPATDAGSYELLWRRTWDAATTGEAALDLLC